MCWVVCCVSLFWLGKEVSAGSIQISRDVPPVAVFLHDAVQLTNVTNELRSEICDK